MFTVTSARSSHIYSEAPYPRPEEHRARVSASAPASISTSAFASPAIADLHVLDWDDCIRDKIGMNYELLHNAITITANRYGAQYPCLLDLADVMANPHEEVAAAAREVMQAVGVADVRAMPRLYM